MGPKLPDTLAKLRDELSVNNSGQDLFGNESQTYLQQRRDLDLFSMKRGFDAGAEAMRIYMQAEMDKLVEVLEEVAKMRYTIFSPYPENEMHTEIRETGESIKARKALASYRAWKDGK